MPEDITLFRKIVCVVEEEGGGGVFCVPVFSVSFAVGTSTVDRPQIGHP
jgi:hypothetical protein